jgi:hypothetical protein
MNFLVKVAMFWHRGVPTLRAEMDFKEAGFEIKIISV